MIVKDYVFIEFFRVEFFSVQSGCSKFDFFITDVF